MAVAAGFDNHKKAVFEFGKEMGNAIGRNPVGVGNCWLPLTHGSSWRRNHGLWAGIPLGFKKLAVCPAQTQACSIHKPGFLSSAKDVGKGKGLQPA